MKITKPVEEHVPEFYRGYINHCTEEDLIQSLTTSKEELEQVLSIISDEKQDYRYAEGKWSVKEVLLHLIDGERVFSYRALRFSRFDNTPLPGFEENLYVPNSNAEERSLVSIGREFETLRLSNIEMFKGMTEEMLNFKGTANDNIMTACSLGWTISGHLKHHIKVLRERYLQ
jgi:hypothetical protein